MADIPNNRMLASVHALSKILFRPSVARKIYMAGATTMYRAWLCAAPGPLKTDNITTARLNAATSGNLFNKTSPEINAKRMADISKLK